MKLWLHYIQLKILHMTTCVQWNVRHHDVLLSDLVCHILNKIVTIIYMLCNYVHKTIHLPTQYTQCVAKKHGTNFVIILNASKSR